MFNRLVHANGLKAEFTKYELDKQDMTFIREQIGGPSKTKKGVCIFYLQTILLNIANICVS